jgi:hypothetical protein
MGARIGEEIYFDYPRVGQLSEVERKDDNKKGPDRRTSWCKNRQSMAF